MNKITTNEGEEPEKSLRNYKKYIVWSVFGVIAVWAMTFLLYLNNNSEERGQFGDMFGAANALFSGLAFVGLIITLILQREELSLQRDELKQTRKEFENQNKTMKRQRFENTFFNLMSLHQNITVNLELKNSAFNNDASPLKGREVFKQLYQKEYKSLFGFNLNYGYEDPKELLDSWYFEVFNHYLHFFEGILRFIDESDLLEDIERQQYAIMLRNTLSDFERYTIFYYFVAHGGWHKDIAEKYGLFYGIKSFGLGDNTHYNLFEQSAYAYNGKMSN